MAVLYDPSDMSSRRPIRLRHYDYSQTGWYFVTICTKDKEWSFGRCSSEGIALSDIGRIAERHLVEIPDHYPPAMIDRYVVMPNHVHGIIAIQPVGAPHVVPAEPHLNTFSKAIRNSLSVIIQQYKSTVKRWCNKNAFPHFQWQSRFYEHVIRNEDDLKDIRNYIKNNPLRWIEGKTDVPFKTDGT
jgi:REP element-mobilizing transposase RayT